MAATGGKTIEQMYQKMTPLEHIKKLPDTYIGSIERTDAEMWVWNRENQRMEKRQVSFIPGLYKIFDEIIVNCIDQHVRMRVAGSDNPVTIMRVSINQETGEISVYNNGDGIDVEVHQEHHMYVPELIFGNLLTSANYDANEKKITGGKNGYGAKLTNIFSRHFTVETVDAKRKKKYIQNFHDGMTVKEAPIITSSSIKPYTRITFLPDYALFGMAGLDPDILSLMYRRVYDMAACTDKSVSVYLNEEKLECKSLERYVDLYLGSRTEKERVYEEVNDRWEVVACVAPDHHMEHVSFVNGIYTYKGGKHVENVVTQIARKVQNYASTKGINRKKYEVKQNHIKENLWVFIRSTIENPAFDSQTKETLTTNVAQFGSRCDLSEKFVEKLVKMGLLERALRLEEFKDSVTLGKQEGGKKKSTIRGIPKLEDANWAGTDKSAQCTLILTEGDSAKTFAISGLSIVGRDRYGVFPLKGKLLNVRDVTDKRVSENEEINSLKKILGLQQYDETGKRKVYDDVNELRYGHVLILTDQDVDGSHIKGLVMNLFHTYWPSLLTIDGFIQTMATPIVKVRHLKEVQTFYTMTEYKQWKESVTNPHLWDIKYYKGLGTSTSQEAKEYFQVIDQSIVNYIHQDATSDDAMRLAFDKAFADQRKEWLRQYNHENIIEQCEKKISIQDFVNRDLIHFSNYDNERSIPSICDGLKPSQRKVLFSVLKRNLTKEVKVAQLSGYVSEHSAYHHGEMSLNNTIIGLAHDFVGSNNINLLIPKGQFGTRIQGGKDSASPRYIYTLMSELTQLLFNSKDNSLLEFQEEDSMRIEPKWYLPIIPFILVNGCDGVGTGFSSQIPCFNPLDLVKNLRHLMAGEEMEPMIPWYRGFKGTIYEKEMKYYSKGLYRVIDQQTVEVTELPIGTWTENYKMYLDDLVIDKTAEDKKKKNQCLIQYDSYFTESNVHFVLRFDKKILAELLEDHTMEKLERVLDMTDSKFTAINNMHLHNSLGSIVKYRGPEEILQEFFVIRLVYYQRRKEHLIAELENDLQFLRSKIRFIEGVIDKSLDIYHKDDDEIEELLEANKFPRLGENPSYKYLIDLPIRSLTKRKVDELKQTLIKKERELEELQAKTAQDLWVDDLDEFSHMYKRVMSDYQVAANANASLTMANGSSSKKKRTPAAIVSQPASPVATTPTPTPPPPLQQQAEEIPDVIGQLKKKIAIKKGKK